jgi:glycosyltransferase involved in cell wall biosynthesis
MVPRVLMLGWGYPPNVTGGLDTHVGEVFDRMEARDDVEAELILPAEYAPEGRENIEGVATGDGDIITRIGRLSKRFAEKAAEGDFDVVHTHDWFGYGPGSRAQQSDEDVEWITSFHSLSSDRNVDPPQREVETEQRVTNRSDYLISVSHLLADKLKREYGGDSHVVHNGFTEPEFGGRDMKAELGIDGEMLFFVGRHTDQKGISHLIYAMKKLRNPDVTLVVGGKGHLTEQLKKFVDLLGIEDQVEFVGYIPEEELGDYYASADVFVSPSLSEPFGITVTEALAAGTHVVSTPAGVIECLPEDCVVEVEIDSDSIAGGIEKGLERAREGPPVYEPRTWDEVVDETIAVYEKVATGDY